MVDGPRRKWIVGPCSKEHSVSIRRKRGTVGVTVGVDRRIEQLSRTKRFIRGIPGRLVDFEHKVRRHPCEIGGEFVLADADRTLEEGVLTPGPRLTTSPHGSLTEARCETQRSGHGGLFGPGRFEAKYRASPSSEIEGVMSKKGLEIGGGTRSGGPQSSCVDARRLT